MPRCRTPKPSVATEPYLRYSDTTCKIHVEVEIKLSNGRSFRRASAYKAVSKDDETALSKAISKRDVFLDELQKAQAGTLVVKSHTVRSWGEECHGENGRGGIWKQNDAVRATTQYQHFRNLSRWLYPIYGDVELGRLSTKQIREIVADMTKGGLGAHAQANVKNAISKLYSTALAECEHETDGRFLPPGYNPTKPVVIKRKAKKRNAEGETIEHRRLLSIEEQERLLVAAEPHRIYGPCLVGLKMGLRRGEILAFSLRNVNWERRTYHVREQIVYEVGAGTKIYPLKKESGERHVPIHPRLYEYLLSIRDEVGPSRWTWTRQDDAPLLPRKFSAWFSLVAKRAKLTGNVDEWGDPLPDPSPHDMRHSFASTLASSYDVKLQDLAGLIGDTVATTAEYYVQASLDDLASAVAMLP